MKKSKIISAVAFGLFLLASTNIQAQKFPGLDKSPMDKTMFPNDNKNPDKTALVYYSRPQLKGRALLTELTPAGKVWRTGANEATEITFYKDVFLGKTKIKAGTYSLYTIPNEKEWTIILNKDTNIWGAYTYKEANDVARLNVPATQAEDALEAFSMVFTKADNGMILNLGWDKTRVGIPFTE